MLLHDRKERKLTKQLSQPGEKKGSCGEGVRGVLYREEEGNMMEKRELLGGTREKELWGVQGRRSCGVQGRRGSCGEQGRRGSCGIQRRSGVQGEDGIVGVQVKRGV